MFATPSSQSGISTPHAELARRRGDFALWTVPVAVIVLDQISKWAVATSMDLHQSVAVLGEWLRFTYIKNPGGAFGLRWGHVGFYYAAASLVILWIIWHLWHQHAPRRLSTGALALILGGAIGNLIDRLIQGEVIDFIDAEFPDMTIPAFDFGFIHHPGLQMDRWPTFNVADSAVTVGVILLIITLFRDPVLGRRTPIDVTSPGEPASGDTAPAANEGGRANS